MRGRRPSDGRSTATRLEREGLAVETEANASDGLDRLVADERFDCVVSEYDMPETNGPEFLRAVREKHPDLPFVFFAGTGSEEIASKAISAGVTDYLRKGTGPERYEELANRIRNSAERYCAERALERREERYRRLVDPRAPNAPNHVPVPARVRPRDDRDDRLRGWKAPWEPPT